MLRGKRLRHERRARRPLAAHAEPEQHAEDGKLSDRLREAARRREDRIAEDGGHQRACAADPVRDDARHDAAGRGGEECDRSENAGGADGEVKNGIVDELGEDDRVEHHVERVEHPAERGRDERAPGPRVRLSPPRHFGVKWLFSSQMNSMISLSGMISCTCLTVHGFVKIFGSFTVMSMFIRP